MFVSCGWVKKAIAMLVSIVVFMGAISLQVYAASLTISSKDITTDSATIYGTASVDGVDAADILRWIEYDKGTNSNGANKTPVTESAFANGVTITRLSPNTQYTVSVYVSYPGSPEGGDYVTHTFTTQPLPITPPVVETKSATYLNNAISVVCELKENGNDSSTEVGFYYSTTEPSPNKDTSNTTKVIGSSGSITIGTSDFGKTYNICAYATNNGGNNIAYGSVIKVTPTAPVVNVVIPTVSTSNPSFSGSTITFNGKITSSGNGTITERGFVYSKSTTTPTISNDKVMQSTVSDTLSATLSNQPSNQTYYIRAYAINSAGPGYGETVIVTTAAPTVPAVVTNACSYSGTTVSLSGRISSTGNDIVLERGFVYSTSSSNQSPTTSSNNGQRPVALPSPSASPTILNNFTDSFTGTAGTTYYIRAYVRNSKDTKYGATQTVTIPSANKPTVTISSASYSTSSGKITAYGTVSSVGTGSISETGFIYSTSTTAPTTNSAKQTSSYKTSSISHSFSVSLGYTYYVWAYAKNSSGHTGFSPTYITVTTGDSSDLPTVRTDSVYNVNSSTAQVEIYVSNSGGYNISQRGVIYSTSVSTPTLNESGTSYTTTTGTTGAGTVSLSGLKSSTRYYVRAYAKNSKGYVGYGTVKTLTTTTTSSIAKSVEVRGIMATTATFKGEILDTSTAVTECGVVYAKTADPTTSSPKVKSSSNSKGSFTVEIINLSIDTKYYARAYAITKNGTTYGDSIPFTTLDSAEATTSSVSSIKQTSALLNGKASNDSSKPITERGFVYSSKYPVPTVADSKVLSNSVATGSYSVAISNLAQKTTYYVRAYVKTSLGISYGNVVTFTTLAQDAVITVNMKNLNGDALKTQTITTEYGKTLSKSNLQLPVGYAMFDANWKYDVTVTAATTVIIKKIESAFMQGSGDKFYPDKAATRAEVAQVIYALSVDRTVSGQAKTFPDVTSAHPAKAAIEYCSSKGYMNGFPDGTFRPNENVTRAQMSVVLCLVYNLTGTATSNFTDLKVSHWSYNYVSLATTKGMIAGYTDRSYKPDNNSTKAEVCSMFSDAEKRTLTPLGTAVFSDVPKSHWAYNKIMNAAIPK